MGERVVWLEDWRMPGFGHILGRAADGESAWVVAGDEALRSTQAAPPVVLYFDGADYERAVSR